MDSEFARFLEIKPQTLATWHSRNTFDINIIYSKCYEISPDFLLTGKGEMLRNVAEKKEENPMAVELLDYKNKEIEALKEQLKECQEEKKIATNSKSNV
jgi:hypothetical protein